MAGERFQSRRIKKGGYSKLQKQKEELCFPEPSKKVILSTEPSEHFGASNFPDLGSGPFWETSRGKQA